MPRHLLAARSASASMPNVTRAFELIVLVRRDALDLGLRQRIGPDPRDAPGLVLAGIPPGGGIAADRPFAHVAIVQVGDAQVEILGPIAGDVAPRPEALLADELEPRLEDVADIGIEAVHRRAPIDQKHRQRAHLLVRRRASGS